MHINNAVSVRQVYGSFAYVFVYERLPLPRRTGPAERGVIMCCMVI